MPHGRTGTKLLSCQGSPRRTGTICCPLLSKTCPDPLFQKRDFSPLCCAANPLQTPPMAPRPVPVLGMSAAVRGEARARAIVRDHRATLSEWERSSRARHQPGWPIRRRARPDVETGAQVPQPALRPLSHRHAAASCYVVSLSRSRVTSDHSKALRLGACSRAVGGTHLKWRETACGPSRWPVRMESIGEHRGVVTAIGAEVASVLAAVSRA